MTRLLPILVILAFLIPNEGKGDLIDVDDLEGKGKTEDKESKPTKPELPSPTVAPPPPGLDELPPEDKPPPVPPPPKPAAKAKSKKKGQGKGAQREDREPIRLKSDGKSTYSKDGGVIHLEKNVVITQAELRLQADEAKVYLNETGSSSEDNVDKVEVNGNVRVSKFSENPAEKMAARGDKAYFYNRKRKVTLVGNARLWRGGHLMKGKQITYDLDSGLTTIDRAEGIVQPGEAKNEKP